MIQVAYVIFWWLVLMVIGLISFPLVSRVCSRLPDRGYSISKLVGLVILTFLVWMISSLHVMPFGYISILLSLLLLAAFSLYLGRKNLRIADWPRKQIIISESIFTVAFIAFLLIIRGNPDIYFNGAGDALFNCGFIESILRGGYFPPLDPWFAGESIPYYYGGHVMVAVLTKLTGIPPAIAFKPCFLPLRYALPMAWVTTSPRGSSMVSLPFYSSALRDTHQGRFNLLPMSLTNRSWAFTPQEPLISQIGCSALISGVPSGW